MGKDPRGLLIKLGVSQNVAWSNEQFAAGDAVISHFILSSLFIPYLLIVPHSSLWSGRLWGDVSAFHPPVLLKAEEAQMRQGSKMQRWQIHRQAPSDRLEEVWRCTVRFGHTSRFTSSLNNRFTVTVCSFFKNFRVYSLRIFIYCFF